jgi:hypothetical protein
MMREMRFLKLRKEVGRCSMTDDAFGRQQRESLGQK